MSTVRYAVLSGTVRYGTECVNVRTVLFLIFIPKIQTFIFEICIFSLKEVFLNMIEARSQFYEMRKDV